LKIDLEKKKEILELDLEYYANQLLLKISNQETEVRLPQHLLSYVHKQL